MKKPFLILLAALASPLIAPSAAQALGTPCDACFGNRTGCGSYFLQSCNEGNGQYAYYRSKSSTVWQSKCSDGTYYTNTDCSNVFGTIKNVCKVPCANVGAMDAAQSSEAAADATDAVPAAPTDLEDKGEPSEDKPE